MKISLVLVGLVVAILGIAACGGESATPITLPTKAEGVLTGVVEIGPLCPVEPCEPAINPYSPRTLLLNQPGELPIEVPLQQDGGFSALLPAGTYSVELSECEFLGCSAVLPLSTTIESGGTTSLTVHIDTGIRSPISPVTPTPIATPTIPPPPGAAATPTPSVTREWDLEGIKVDGSTVTVQLHVYSGIDVQATLDGRAPDKVTSALPSLGFIFQNVTTGEHILAVGDVVGFQETARVTVPAPGRPRWLTGLIRKMEKEPVADPPASVIQYQYKGRTVYYVPPRCCDIFSDLYDADGNIIGHPDGGITGQGDGRVPDFFQERSDGGQVWEDAREQDPGLTQAPAPIERVEVLILKSFPPQYNLVVVSGLPNSCASFGGYRLERDDETVRIEVVNWKPSNPDVACAEIYRTVETTILLGSDFVPGSTYTVLVNDVTETFVTQ